MGNFLKSLLEEFKSTKIYNLNMEYTISDKPIRCPITSDWYISESIVILGVNGITATELTYYRVPDSNIYASPQCCDWIYIIKIVDNAVIWLSIKAVRDKQNGIYMI